MIGQLLQATARTLDICARALESEMPPEEVAEHLRATADILREAQQAVDPPRFADPRPLLRGESLRETLRDG